MSSQNNETTKTPEQLADENRRDVMAYAYKDANGNLFSINQAGELVAAPGVKALSPEFQMKADKMAAFVKTIAKVKELNPEDKGIIASILGGAKEGGKKISNEGSAVLDSLGINMDVPGKGLFDFVGNFADGLSVPVDVAKGLFTTTIDVGKEFTGSTMTQNDALAIGTAYASALQVASEERPGFFSKYCLDYVMAAVKWAFSKGCDMFGIDKDHEWGWHKKGDFKEIMNEEARERDHKRVKSEIEKLNQIGGMSKEELAIITTGGIVRDANGNAREASADGTGYTDGNNANTVSEADKGMQNGEKRSLGTRIADAVKNGDLKELPKPTSGAGWLGAAAGTFVGGDAVLGAARGTTSKIVISKSQAAGHAEHWTKEANALGEKAVAAREGTLPKKFMGIESKWFGTKAPSDELASKYAAEMETAKNTAVKYGKIAEAEERGIAAWAETRPTRWWRGGHKVGSWVGEKAGSVLNRTVGTIETGTAARGIAGNMLLKNAATGLAVWDTSGLIYDIASDNYRGAAQNAGELAGAYGGNAGVRRLLATEAGEKTLERAALGLESNLMKAAPGEAKAAIVGLAGVAGLVGGKYAGSAIGEYTYDKLAGQAAKEYVQRNAAEVDPDMVKPLTEQHYAAMNAGMTPEQVREAAGFNQLDSKTKQTVVGSGSTVNPSTVTVQGGTVVNTNAMAK